MQIEKFLGENVRREREKAGISIEEAAERLGVSRARISQIECAVKQPRPSTLKRLAEAFGVDPEAFYDKKESVDFPDVVRWLEKEFSHDVAVRISEGHVTEHEWGVIGEMYKRFFAKKEDKT